MIVPRKLDGWHQESYYELWESECLQVSYSKALAVCEFPGRYSMPSQPLGARTGHWQPYQAPESPVIVFSCWRQPVCCRANIVSVLSATQGSAATLHIADHSWHDTWDCRDLVDNATTLDIMRKNSKPLKGSANYQMQSNTCQSTMMYCCWA